LRLVDWLIPGRPASGHATLGSSNNYAAAIITQGIYCSLVRGANSDFIADNDADEMHHWFSHLREEIVPSAGHNVHVENRAGFLEVLNDWL